MSVDNRSWQPSAADNFAKRVSNGLQISNNEAIKSNESYGHWGYRKVSSFASAAVFMVKSTAKSVVVDSIWHRYIRPLVGSMHIVGSEHQQVIDEFRAINNSLQELKTQTQEKLKAAEEHLSFKKWDINDAYTGIGWVIGDADGDNALASSARSEHANVEADYIETYNAIIRSHNFEKQRLVERRDELEKYARRWIDGAEGTLLEFDQLPESIGLRSQWDRDHRALKEKSDKLDRTTQELASADQIITQQDKKLQAAQIEVDALRSSQKCAIEYQKSLSAMLRNSKDELAKIKTELQARENQILAREEQAINDQRGQMQAIATAVSAQEELEKLQQELAAVKQQSQNDKERLEEENRALTEQANQLRSRESAPKPTVVQQSVSMQTSPMVDNNEQVSTLTEQLADKERANTELAAKLAEVQGEHGQMLSALQELTGCKDDLAEQLKKAKVLGRTPTAGEAFRLFVSTWTGKSDKQWQETLNKVGNGTTAVEQPIAVH